MRSPQTGQSPLFFSLYSVRGHKKDATHTQAESSHLIQPKLKNLSHTHTQECVSQMTPDPVNLAINTNITPSSLQIWDPTPVIFCYRNVIATYSFGADRIRRKKQTTYPREGNFSEKSWGMIPRKQTAHITSRRHSNPAQDLISHPASSDLVNVSSQFKP